MARTKITPRKRVLVPDVEVPAGAVWRYQPPAEFYSDGQLAGYFARTLWYLLQGLGYHDAPLFKGVRVPLGDRGYSWTVEVTMFEKPSADDLRRVRRVHTATAPRATFEAGIEDAARQALAVLCRENRQDLRLTQFGKFPQRPSGSLEVIFAPVNNEPDLRLREQVRLTAALYAELDRALDELEDLHQRHAEQEQMIYELEIMLQDPDQHPDEAPPAPPSAPAPPRSPSRKRLRQADVAGPSGTAGQE
jgi:hypothetical protein